MDYEKKYKEALERCRKLYNEAKSCEYTTDMEDYETIFPELKSEDERIRKTLIDMFSSNGKKDWRNIPTQKIIAWLEKQGEVDTASYEIAENEKREFIGDGFIKCHADFKDFKEGETYWLEYIGNDNYNVRSDNLLGKTYRITPGQLYLVFKKTTWLEKQSEQKPQRMISAEAKEALYDKPADSYCEENCKGYNERQGQVKKSSETQHENKTCKENADSLTQDNDERKPSDKDWVEALRTEYEKGRADAIAEMQKPADGTFVDIDDVREDFMAEVYRVLDADPTNDRANQIIDAFDSLPITSIQKPAEWSEKDESHRIGIMQTISGAIKLNVISKKTGDMQIGWLKSLKPQNRWKPSEEQMNALNAMILNYSLSQNATLVELYNDLKKLKD